MYHEKPKRIAVLGAGAVGLTAAYELSDLLKQSKTDAQLTVIADKFTTETTSFGAAGIFRITYGLTKAETPELLKHYAAEGWKWFDSIARSVESNRAGISVLSGFQVYTEEPRWDSLVYKDIVYNFNLVSPQSLTFLPNRDDYATAIAITTLVIESRRLLPWLTTHLLDRGVRFEKRKVENLDEISDKYDCLVNCTGIGSRQLFNDEKMYPIRGHLVKLKAPWIRNFIYADHDTYIVPGIDHVSVGGLLQPNDTRTEIDPRETADIRRRGYRFAPSLATAPLDFEWIGFRPARETLRVSLESVRSVTGREIPVVFNVGHGANGIALSMGTSKAAARYVMDVMGCNYSKL